MPEGNVAVAFACVIGAGACTSLGAALAFCINLEVVFYIFLCFAFVGRAADPGKFPKFICGDRAPLNLLVACCVQNKRFLAVSLALSCGVMFYVSMVEIFVKSLNAFRCCPSCVDSRLSLSGGFSKKMLQGSALYVIN
jgi:zinc transporter ZupT